MPTLDPKAVTVYATEWCPFCQRARMLLAQKNVEYILLDTDAEPQRKLDMQALGGARTVPQIFVGETLVGGYTELAALEMQGKLDALLNSIN